MLETVLTPALAEFLKAYGLAGIVILALCWVCKTLYLRNCEIQDRRLEDAKELRAVLEAATAAKVANTLTIEKLADLVSRRAMQ